MNRRTTNQAASAATLCLLAGLAGGCGSAGGAASSATSQERFLTELRQAAPDSAYSKDEQLLATGQHVCEELAAGTDLEHLSARNPAENLTDETVERIRITQALASQHLCPDAA
ncbi:DUF732 domain-containing protein [Arthrobacter sp. TB 23]|uniref:DUF732 domain-containing protein n=1 Tax=Arthrobacter sp. TB 23 TaxID=494419 RepID=UPI000363E601|nr:DUF732 domain-containing protein [Arthrobacter sp. TB 23]